MKSDLTLQLILDECSARLNVGQPQLDKFTANLTGGDDPEKASPIYAFKWAESAIEETAKRHELMRLAAWAEHQLGEVGEGNTTEEAALASILAHYQRELLQKATSTGRSTSPLSNLIEDHERAASARVFSWLSGEYFSGF